MDIYVPETNPNLLDVQFIELHPALGLVTTSNSGAFWGDGDGRPRSIQYDRVQFALESKARFSASHKTLKPTPAEWEKAMQQLRVRNRSAIRLFLVYNANLRTYAVSIPENDTQMLTELGYNVPGETLTLRRRGVKISFRHLEYEAWKQLYAEIEQKNLVA